MNLPGEMKMKNARYLMLAILFVGTHASANGRLMLPFNLGYGYSSVIGGAASGNGSVAAGPGGASPTGLVAEKATVLGATYQSLGGANIFGAALGTSSGKFGAGAGVSLTQSSAGTAVGPISAGLAFRAGKSLAVGAVSSLDISSGSLVPAFHGGIGIGNGTSGFNLGVVLTSIGSGSMGLGAGVGFGDAKKLAVAIDVTMPGLNPSLMILGVTAASRAGNVATFYGNISLIMLFPVPVPTFGVNLALGKSFGIQASLAGLSTPQLGLNFAF